MQGAGYTYAWVDAEGTSAEGSTAVYCSGKCGNATSPAQSQAQQMLDKAASTLQWSDGRAVASDLKLPPRQPSKGFTGHDCLCEMAGFHVNATRTCSRVFSRLPAPEDKDITDGTAWIWLFDCGKVAPFICQCKYLCRLSLLDACGGGRLYVASSIRISRATDTHTGDDLYGLRWTPLLSTLKGSMAACLNGY